LAEVFQPDRLDQIADRADLEGFEREFIMRGVEDHRGRRVPLTELGGNLQSVQAGHTDILQDDIGPQLLDQGEGLIAIAGGRFQDTIAVKLTYQSAEALAG